MAVVTKERAERIARAQACPRCSEYTYKKLKLRAAEPSDHIDGAAWIAELGGSARFVGKRADDEAGRNYR